MYSPNYPVRVRSARFSSAGARRYRGLTLIEILVSITLTLILLGTVMTVFSLITGAVADSRSMMGMVDRQRAATSRLQDDLQGHTAQTLPPLRPEGAPGYFEYIEGTSSDLSVTVIPDGELYGRLRDAKVLGDIDDILMMTVRSRGAPFVGQGPGGTIQSQVAEVVWFVRQANIDRPIKPLNLYRRVLLIRPDLPVSGGSCEEFQRQYDISVRMEGSELMANTLEDLTEPENRFAHMSTGTTGQVNLSSALLTPFDDQYGRFGEDIILQNCVGFDIQAYDPRANAGLGDYVGLGQGGGGIFGNPPATSVGSVSGIFDTWSFHYEYDGPQGTPVDGQESDTPPPYDQPLRGVQVKVRAYEPDSRQVREVTVRGDFMPE